MNILDLIGNTPLVKIVYPVKCRFATISPEAKLSNKVNIFAKLEGFNPSGSIKDRLALAMIEKAEKKGTLSPGKTIIGPTSGNTGISLAMVGTIKGYKVKVVMPESISTMKRKMIEIFGGEIILVKERDWRNNAIKFTKEIVEKDKHNLVLLNQYEDEINIWVHYRTTAQEILDQCDEKGSGYINFFVAGIGTGGTITGVGKRLKEKFPNIKIIGVQPKPGKNIEGLKSLKEGYVPPILDLKIVDEIIEVEEKDAIETAKKLAKTEGIFVGHSSGAAMFVAQKIAQKIKNENIVTIFPDRGERYL